MGHQIGVGPRRTLLFASAATFSAGLIGVGIGTLLGGSTVYYLFIRQKLDSIFAFQRNVRIELETLRAEIRQLKSGNNSKNSASNSHKPGQGQPLKSSLKEKRTVKFANSNGYETADEEEYVTASSSEISESEDDGKESGDHDRYANLTGLARRVPGSEK